VGVFNFIRDTNERAHRKTNPVGYAKPTGRTLKGKSLKEVIKGVWGMPRLSEAKKDVISCDKLRGFANRI
jgi:hypothetical protein